MTHHCSFPGCDFQTDNKRYIDSHHICPKEVNPSRSNKVTIPLCPSCHRKIFHPKSRYGHHSIISEESLEVLGVFKSSDGQAIHYRSPITYESFYYMTSDGSILSADEKPERSTQKT